jgi:hypothetical protein
MDYFLFNRPLIGHFVAMFYYRAPVVAAMAHFQRWLRTDTDHCKMTSGTVVRGLRLQKHHPIWIAQKKKYR